MSNSLLTIDMITREALMLFINTNAFIKNMNRQYDGQFARDGAKIGDTLRIRLPNDFVVTDGPGASVQATNEQFTTLTVAYQRHIDTSFSSVDMTLKLDDYVERILKPKINKLAGNVASTVMSGADGGAANYVAKLSSTDVTAPDSSTWLLAGARLDDQSALRYKRKIVMAPSTQAKTVSSLTGLFNPQSKISSQYESGEMSVNTLGFDWMMDQTVIRHTNGTATTATVSGADQTGTTLTISALSGTLKKGDFITIAAVYAVNRVTNQSTYQLRQFVLTADADNGATSLSIYPAITPAASNGSAVQYQTVDVSPADGAVITPVSKASETTVRNLAYLPDAITLGSADLVMPPNVEGARHAYDGVSMRAVKQYQIGTDQLIDRLDVLFGYRYLRPEWVCVVADSTSYS